MVHCHCWGEPHAMEANSLTELVTMIVTARLMKPGLLCCFAVSSGWCAIPQVPMQGPAIGSL
jgi:hypothetical protein